MKQFQHTIIRSCAFLLAFFWSLSTHENLGDKKDPAQEGASGALQALEFWTAARAYPDADIPPDKYYRAYLEAKTRIPTFDPLQQGPITLPWQFLGPTNFSGRMISVAINPLNPNTVYAGAASGGLWRSSTAGLGGDWQRVPTGFPVLGVNAIAIHPTDTGTIYIGTGEVYRYQGSLGGIVIRTTRGSVGMGILMTTDAGASWTRVLDWSYNQQRGVQAIRFNPRNPSTLFAATSEGVYRSTDAGATWNSVLSVLMARDIAISPLDTMRVLTTAGNFASAGAGVYRSTDGGLSFSRITSLPNFSGYATLEIYGANPAKVFASLADSTTGTGSLWRSENFGGSWTLVNSSAIYGVQGWYSQFVAVHPTDSTQVVRGTQQTYKSTNGGISHFGVSGMWADNHAYAHHPTNPNILYVADDGGIWRSTNFGSTYQYVGVGLLTSQFYNGFSASASDSLLALGQVQDHFGWMYTGSLTWVDGGVDEVGWTAVNQTNDFIMYAGSRGGGALYKSTDRGINYSIASSGFTGRSCWNTPFVLSRSNPNVLYFGRSRVFKTTDAGGSWTATNAGVELDGNPMLSMAVSATSPDTVVAGTAPLVSRARVFRTTNGGTTWTDVTDTLPDRYPMDVTFDPNDSRTIYIAFGGFNAPHLFKSTNLGNSWTNLTGILPDVPATAVVIDPLNSSHVYVGTDIGVFVSTDAGSNWTSFDEGLPEAVIVSDLAISPSNRALKLATHSSGVFERKLLHGQPTRVSDREIPRGFDLAQNYPNPFNPRTEIQFRIAKLSHVSLKIFDAAGRQVATLVDERKSPGTYSVRWDAKNMASGTYFYRLSGDNFVQTRKMILLK